jgi:hypothetical protein
MRTLLTSVVGALLILAPLRAAAAEIRFLLDITPLIRFGSEPATVLAGFGGFGGVFKDGKIFFALPNGSEIHGEFGLTSGPLLALDVTNDASGMPVRSVYEYGPGEVTVTALWDGDTRTGVFQAPIFGLTVDIREDQCGPFGCNKTGTAKALLGPGLFDSFLAAALGVDGPSVGGLFTAAAIDRITGTPASDNRIGGMEGAGNCV